MSCARCKMTENQVPRKTSKIIGENIAKNAKVSQIEIDGCEYLVVQISHGRSHVEVVHKANCKNH